MKKADTPLPPGPCSSMGKGCCFQIRDTDETQGLCRKQIRHCRVRGMVYREE